MRLILRTYRLRYHAKQATIGLLMCIGFIALTGEPTEDTNFLVCLLLQLLTWGITWATALWLYHRWGIDKVEKRIKRLKNQ